MTSSVDTGSREENASNKSVAATFSHKILDPDAAAPEPYDVDDVQ
jgi:hypothetical protein